MQIKTQPIREAIELKNSGIAFDVYNNAAKRIGDLAVTKNGLVWNNGNALRTRGVTVKWDTFINWMQSQQTLAKAPVRTQPQPRTQTQPQSKAPARTQPQARTPVQPQTRTLKPSQTRTAPQTKIAAKTGNAVTAKKPAIKITASAKTARKKAN